ATKLQNLTLGRGTAQHALIAGKTGSGKSTLLHVLITNLALWYSPDEIEFYLVDFKKGVEFKTYATHKLPHARVVAVESDREFGISVLQRIDAELKRRGELFRELGVQDIAGFRDKSTERMPRILLIIDEFQELFVDDDRVAQEASLLLDRLVRQGRAFGIHAIMGSQTLDGAYTLSRSTMGQMAVRVALQCSEQDSYIILNEDNAAARLLSRPGEAIYNDAAGNIEGNSPFQVVWLNDKEREIFIKDLIKRDNGIKRDMVVYEGNQPVHLAENPVYKAASNTE
ncbi:MAG TPA: DNA translocase FtsK, partial [Phycisphaerales bacterium]|nr:DNA translocase FtsK [Phycisphaerales bacterium]